MANFVLVTFKEDSPSLSPGLQALPASSTTDSSGSSSNPSQPSALPPSSTTDSAKSSSKPSHPSALPPSSKTDSSESSSNPSHPSSNPAPSPSSDSTTGLSSLDIPPCDSSPDPVLVIGDEYCLPQFTNLKVCMDNGENNVHIFNVKGPTFSLHSRRVLYDVDGRPVATLYNQIMTMHGRCQAFRGKSKDSSQLLFTIKRSKAFQRGKIIDLDVFLAPNVDQTVCDFKVKMSSDRKSGDIYAGESSQIVAKMQNLYPDILSQLKAKKKDENIEFYQEVLVYPRIDYAFIVALLLIINNMQLDVIKEIAMEVAAEVITGGVF